MPEKAAQKEPGKKPKPQQEVIVHVPLSKLHDFPNHPFKVRDDEAMQETAESIRQYGVLVPAIVLSIMMEQKKPEKNDITLSGEKLRKYFPRSYTPFQIENTIFKLLEAWQKKRQRDQSR